MKKLLSSIGIALMILALAVPGAVLAAEATASRDLPATAVEPGAEFEVGITASDYGPFGQVVETLPAGFSYVSSSLDASQVDVAGSVVRFILIGDPSFTYIVTASTVEDTYAFSGIIKDSDLNEFTVLGDPEITVGEAAPPATTASRDLPATAVESGAEFEVGITASDYGMMGQVVETLPTGFSYVSSSLDASQVDVAGSVVSFVLIGEPSFTYIVTAATVEDTYPFSGIIKDIDLNEFTVLGDPEITVGPPPPQPAIAFEPETFIFSATKGGANPANQILDIWNLGEEGSLLEWSVSDDADWLILAPIIGSSVDADDVGQVTLAVDISVMTADEYSATIIISAEEATNSPQLVPVSLTISPEPITVTWNCPRDHVALIAPFPANDRPILTVSADLSEVTCGDAEWFQVLWLDESTGKWKVFHSEFVEANTLFNLDYDQYYYVIVSAPCDLIIPQ